MYRLLISVLRVNLVNHSQNKLIIKINQSIRVQYIYNNVKIQSNA